MATKINTMTILEHELENLIFGKIESGYFEQLEERGLNLPGHYKYYRQLNLGSYGTADIVGLSIQRDTYVWLVDVCILELKKDAVNMKTLSQALRYAKGVQRIVDDWNWKHAKKRPIELNLSFVLIGQSVDSDIIYTPDFFENVRLYSYELSFDGVFFNEKLDYHLSDEKPFKIPNIKESIFLG